MRYTYENRYGRLVTEVTGEYQRASGISCKKLGLDDSYFFSIDDAEKIALITDNRGIQIAPMVERRAAYLIHHKTGKIAAVCKVVSLDWFDQNIIAEKEIEDLRPKPFGV